MKEIPIKIKKNMVIKKYLNNYILETGHIINNTGKEIWDKIDDKRNTDKIIELLSDEYSKVTLKTLTKDTLNFLKCLHKEGIIKFKK